MVVKAPLLMAGSMTSRSSVQRIVSGKKLRVVCLLLNDSSPMLLIFLLDLLLLILQLFEIRFSNFDISIESSVVTLQMLDLAESLFGKILEILHASC